MNSKIKDSVFDKTIFVGPDIEAKGGIASVLRSYSENFEPFHYLPTNSRRGTLAGLFVVGFSILRMPIERLRGRKILHIHYATGKSWIRKQFLRKWGSLLGFKTIMHCHAAEMKKTVAKNGVSRVRKALDKADANVVLSQSWKDYFNKTIGCRNVHKINNIVNPSDEPAKHMNASPAFVFVGEICTRKGVDDLVEAMNILKKRNKHATLRICGNGNADSLNKKIEEYGLGQTVEYVGWINPEQRKKILSESDVLVLPSFAEGLPISLLEAMAQELAVVSTPVGGIPEIIEENVNGYLVEPGNPESLADALSKYTDDRNLASRQGKEGLKVVSKFYPPQVAEELTELYNDVLKGRHAG